MCSEILFADRGKSKRRIHFTLGDKVKGGEGGRQMNDFSLPFMSISINV